MDDLLNADFQDMLRCSKDTRDHLFLHSNAWYKGAVEHWRQKKIPTGIAKVPHKKGVYAAATSTLDCSYSTPRVITPKQLRDLYEYLTTTTTSFKDVRDRLLGLYKYNLPSTIADAKVHFKEGDYNVLVVGAGPVGLFTALYLLKLIRLRQDSQSHRWNLLVIDNRIHKEGIRKPYTRLTQFGFSIDEIKKVLPSIASWTGRGSDRQFDFISVLENMLYVVAFNEKVPMYFTRDYETYEKCLSMPNVNVILDCTGGRLRRDIPHKLDWSSFNLKKANMEVKYDAQGNVFRLYEDGEQYHDTTLVLKVLDEAFEELPVGNLFGHPTRKEDIVLTQEMTGTCFRLRDYQRLSQQFTGKSLRMLLPTIFHFMEETVRERATYVVVSSFDTSPYHAPSACEVIDPSRTYIAMGNTLGVSEYGIHFGLHTAMKFARRVIHALVQLPASLSANKKTSIVIKRWKGDC